MMATATNNPIVKALINAGIIPQRCLRFTLELEIKNPIKITSVVYATEEEFQTIADALLAHPEAAKDFVHKTFFKPMDDSCQEPISVES